MSSVALQRLLPTTFADKTRQACGGTRYNNGLTAAGGPLRLNG